MKPSEASKKLEFHSKQICHGCMHPSMVGWCENHCQLPEAFKMAISALEKQEKKPAKAKFNRRYNKFVYFCPVCGEVTGKYDFCSECGQAIDYDNTEPYTEEEA